MYYPYFSTKNTCITKIISIFVVLNFNLHETMAKVISILNFKGGVGKSTTAANLGTALWILGYKVLLIDTDPQRNLTYNLNFKGDEGDDTFHEWITSRKDDYPEPVYSRYENLDYIPASRDLREAEEDLVSRKMREYILSRRMGRLRNYYDYIFIDCSPKEGLLNFNSLVASDSVLIPLECSSFSMQGMPNIADAINEALEMPGVEGLDIFGILPVKYDKNTRISKKTIEKIGQYFPCKIFDTKIRRTVRFDECPSKRMTAFEFDPEGNGAEDYMRLAEEITGKTRPENWKSVAYEAFGEKWPELRDRFEQEKEDLKKQKNSRKKKEVKDEQ